ncbi:MAG: hypothetical protein CMM61_03760 [Rhodospirillaceae bacterium]|mgnify:CR=1 FL=1|nr:hypothetical protein [Rhodospirillaceae bacterium]|tara:strand:+ start:241 stop:1716 length:1476 start_codon:yes stop_codon:yes gene_type:complete
MTRHAGQIAAHHTRKFKHGTASSTTTIVSLATPTASPPPPSRSVTSHVNQSFLVVLEGGGVPVGDVAQLAEQALVWAIEEWLTPNVCGGDGCRISVATESVALPPPPSPPPPSPSSLPSPPPPTSDALRAFLREALASKDATAVSASKDGCDTQTPSLRGHCDEWPLYFNASLASEGQYNYLYDVAEDATPDGDDLDDDGHAPRIAHRLGGGDERDAAFFSTFNKHEANGLCEDGLPSTRGYPQSMYSLYLFPGAAPTSNGRTVRAGSDHEVRHYFPCPLGSDCADCGPRHPSDAQTLRSRAQGQSVLPHPWDASFVDAVAEGFRNGTIVRAELPSEHANAVLHRTTGVATALKMGTGAQEGGAPDCSIHAQQDAITASINIVAPEERVHATVELVESALANLKSFQVREGVMLVSCRHHPAVASKSTRRLESSSSSTTITTATTTRTGASTAPATSSTQQLLELCGGAVGAVVMTLGMLGLFAKRAPRRR